MCVASANLRLLLKVEAVYIPSFLMRDRDEEHILLSYPMSSENACLFCNYNVKKYICFEVFGGNPVSVCQNELQRTLPDICYLRSSHCWKLDFGL